MQTREVVDNLKLGAQIHGVEEFNPLTFYLLTSKWTYIVVQNAYLWFCTSDQVRSIISYFLEMLIFTSSKDNNQQWYRHPPLHFITSPWWHCVYHSVPPRAGVTIVMKWQVEGRLVVGMKGWRVVGVADVNATGGVSDVSGGGGGS